MIVRSIPRNVHIVVCERERWRWCPGRVRERSNANFLPGMELRALAHPDYREAFDLVWRCPRQKGRW